MAHDAEYATSMDAGLDEHDDNRDQPSQASTGFAAFVDGDVMTAAAPVGDAERAARLQMFKSSQPKRRVVFNAPETDAERAKSAEMKPPALSRDPRVVERVLKEQRRLRRRMADKVMQTLTGGYIPQQRGPLKSTPAKAPAAVDRTPPRQHDDGLTEEERFARRVRMDASDPNANDGESAERVRPELRCPDREAERVPPLREREPERGGRQQYSREALFQVKQFLQSDDCALEIALYPSVSLVSAGRSAVSLPVVRRAPPRERVFDFRAPPDAHPAAEESRRPAPPPLSEEERAELQQLRMELKMPMGSADELPEDYATSVAHRAPSAQRSPTNEPEAPAGRSPSGARPGADTSGSTTMRVVAKTFVTERSTSVTRIGPQMMTRRAASAAVVPRRLSPTSDVGTPTAPSDPAFTVSEVHVKNGPAPMQRSVYQVDTTANVTRRSRSVGANAQSPFDMAQRASSRPTVPSGYSTFSSAMYAGSSSADPAKFDDRAGSLVSNEGSDARQAFLASALGAGMSLPRLAGGSIAASAGSRSPVDGTMERATPHRGNSPVNHTPSVQSASATPGSRMGTAMNIGVPKGPRGFSIGPKSRDGASGDPSPTWGISPSPSATPNMAFPQKPLAVRDGGAAGGGWAAADRTFVNPEAPPMCTVPQDDATAAEKLTAFNEEIREAAQGKDLRRHLIQDMLGCEVPVWRGHYDISGLGFPPQPTEAQWPITSGRMPQKGEAWEARVEWLETHVALMSAVTQVDRIACRQVVHTQLPSLGIPEESDPEATLRRFVADGKNQGGPRYVFRDSHAGADQKSFERVAFDARAAAPPAAGVEVDGITNYVSARRAPCGNKGAVGNRISTHEFRVADLNACYRDAVLHSRKRFEYASRQFQQMLNANRDQVSRYSARLAIELRRRADRVPATHPIVADFVRLFPDRARENGIRAFPALDIEPRSNQAADFNAVIRSIRAQRRADQAKNGPPRGTGTGGPSPSGTGDPLPPPPQYDPNPSDTDPSGAKPIRRNDVELRAELRMGLRTAEVVRHQRAEKWRMIEAALAEQGRDVSTLPPALRPPVVATKPSLLETQAAWDMQIQKWRAAVGSVTAGNLMSSISATADPAADTCVPSSRPKPKKSRSAAEK